MDNASSEIEDRRHHLIISLQRLIRVREYRYLWLSLTANFLFMEILLLSLSTSFSDIAAMMTAGYVWISALLSSFLAVLFGLAAIMMLYLAANWNIRRGIGRSAVGAGLALISIGCPICGSPLLDLIGFAGGLGDFPLQGLEIKILAAGLLISAIWANSNALNDLILNPSRADQDETSEVSSATRRLRARLIPAVLVFAILAVLLLLPKLPPQAKLSFSSPSVPADLPQAANVDQLVEQVLPSEGVAIPATYGDLGPRLLEVGAIDYDQFVSVYQQAGQALDETQLDILTQGSDQQIVISNDNAYFLLNFFWAFGLTNRNSILHDGDMMMYGNEGVGRFASTGGWTIGSLPATELFSSEPLVALTDEQQARLEAVTKQIYRPCCNNHTAFPDCNHGMAMLGLMELMAAQGASEDEMFEAAKYVSAFWFPQQALEVALFAQVSQGLDFSSLEGKAAVGAELFSGGGFQQLHNWLAENGLLRQSPSSGSSCGV
jgi:hypothetical protein